MALLPLLMPHFAIAVVVELPRLLLSERSNSRWQIFFQYAQKLDLRIEFQSSLTLEIQRSHCVQLERVNNFAYNNE